MGKLEHLPFEFETAETMLHLLGPGVVSAGLWLVARGSAPPASLSA